MKRIHIFAALLCAAVTAGGQAMAQQQERVVRVVGEGAASSAPDLARAVFGATVEAETAAGAADAAARRMAAVIAALRAEAVEERDLRTLEIGLSPIYEREAVEGAPRLRGYAARQRLGVTVRSVARLGPVIDAALAAGATDIGGVEFDVDDRSALLDAARRAAVSDAERAARLLADAAGVALGPLTSLTLGRDHGGPRPMAMRAQADAATPVAPGEISVGATVEAIYAIE